MTFQKFWWTATAWSALTVPPLSFSGLQDPDELRARELVENLGGLTENFTAREFLERPALAELILLDRAAVVPLQAALTHSRDWSTRATAAYLLSQIRDCSGFYAAWRKEPSLAVKAFLFDAASGQAEAKDRAALGQELEDLGTKRRLELLELRERPVPLTDAQIELRIRRLLAYAVHDRGGQFFDRDPDGHRAKIIISDYGARAIPLLADTFFTLTTRDQQLNLILTIYFSLGEIDPADSSQILMAKPHFNTLLRILEFSSAPQSGLRYHSSGLALTMAIVMNYAGEDPEPALKILRGYLAAEETAEVREHAAYLMKLWDEHLKKRAGERGAIPRDSPGSEKKKDPSGSAETPVDGTADCRSLPAWAEAHRSSLVAGAIVAGVLLLLLIAFLRRRRTT